MNNWPRCTRILKDFNLIADAFYFEPRHRRRGRLVDAACNLLGRGIKIEDEWWEQCSGVRDDDRVFHHEVRPFVAAYEKFLAETGFKLRYHAAEVRNSVDRYIGHIDQVGDLYDGTTTLDLKTGGESEFHRFQLGGYGPAVLESLGLHTRRANLYLTDDGKYRLVKRCDRRDITEFQALARAWWVLHPQGSQE